MQFDVVQFYSIGSPVGNRRRAEPNDFPDAAGRTMAIQD
jgi:hypothetical protein